MICPQASDLWRLLDEHFDSFQQIDDESYQAKYGYWRPIVEQSVAAFLKCGDILPSGRPQSGSPPRETAGGVLVFQGGRARLGTRAPP